MSAVKGSITFDDFNVGEGHFAQAPNVSGSTVNILANSTADRVTVSPVEGAGCEQLVINTNGGGAVRVRFLSGGGTVGNNTAFVTSAGTDGWVGCYVKTTNTGWNVQLWLEGGANGQPTATTNNGSVPKNLVADGQWHLYEWDLDNTAGDADGWGSVANIIAGNTTVIDGSHTFDSIILRNNTPEVQTNVIFIDFLAKSDSGSVSNLLANACLTTTGVIISGPISADSNQVIVSGVSATATSVKVYQNTGVGGSMVVIGTKTTGITAGDNVVTVSGLVKAAQVVATQTVTGQESCVPAASAGLTVGGGANPSVRVALSIRETVSTGPAGDPGDVVSTALHFLGANVVSGGAPVNAKIIYPSNTWQTVSFSRGTLVTMPDVTNPNAAVTDGAGYAANDSVSVQVYAYKDVPNAGTRVYSATFAQTSDVTSNDVFKVNWSWDPVAGADGYRVLRSTNFAGYIFDHRDITGTSFTDDGTGWIGGVTVSPTSSRSEPSIQWNPTVSNPNNIPGQWGILESINFAINNLDDTGPFDLYIDNITNGTTRIQSFELAPAHTTDYAFRQPSFSGTTSGSLLTTPNVGEVSNGEADSGTKSFHVRFQWSGTNQTKWLRLTTASVNNPQVNLDDLISFRMLMLPVSAPLPPAPAAPTVSAASVGGKTVLNWTDGHRLQTAVNVSGPYTNVPQSLNPNTWTNVTLGGFLSPYTNSYTEPNRFFRLQD